MKLELNKLNWDSDFFNFNVGRISGIVQNEVDIRDIEFLMNEHDVKLAYYSSLNEVSLFTNPNKVFDVQLVDKKVTYVKDIDAELSFHPSIVSIDSNTSFGNKLNTLAIQSGVYSRFNVDKRIGKEKFEEMYSLWMINSMNHKIAKEVLVLIEDEELKGFVTLGEKNNRADIGIIAVDHFFRGKGIGKTLMTSAEKWFSDKGYKSIQVVTQGDNYPACKLYESCGYKIDTIEFFYHIWKK